VSQVSSSDLFTRLMDRQGEDYFTECVASAMQEDAELAKSFLVCLCGEMLSGTSVDSAAINLKTQVTFAHSQLNKSFRLSHKEYDKDSCVDMVFRVNRDTLIGVENKLGAPEGEGQLLRYLALPLNWVAFIAPDHVAITTEVLAHPKYLRPASGRKHFLWSDFFQLIEESVRKPSATVLNRALLAFFKRHGFEPPMPEIGDLNDPDALTMKKNRENFKKLWELTKTRLGKRGWKQIQHDWDACLWCQGGPAGHTESFYVNSLWPGILLIRLTPYAPDMLGEMETRLKRAGSPLSEFDIIVERRDMKRVKRAEGRRKIGPSTVLEVTTPMTKLFRAAEGAEAKQERLARFVLAVLDQVEFEG